MKIVFSSWSRFSTSFWASGTSLLILSNWSSLITQIVSYLSKIGYYSFVCRWSGGNNAGHRIYKEGIKYKTHLIPSGIFYDIPSIIGPDCVVNVNSFFEEINYLKNNGFNTNLIFISPKAHIITEEHIKEVKSTYNWNTEKEFERFMRFASRYANSLSNN